MKKVLVLSREIHDAVYYYVKVDGCFVSKDCEYAEWRHFYFEDVIELLCSRKFTELTDGHCMIMVAASSVHNGDYNGVDELVTKYHNHKLTHIRNNYPIHTQRTFSNFNGASIFENNGIEFCIIFNNMYFHVDKWDKTNIYFPMSRKIELLCKLYYLEGDIGVSDNKYRYRLLSEVIYDEHYDKAISGGN